MQRDITNDLHFNGVCVTGYYSIDRLMVYNNWVGTNLDIIDTVVDISTHSCNTQVHVHTITIYPQVRMIELAQSNYLIIIIFCNHKFTHNTQKHTDIVHKIMVYNIIIIYNEDYI
jgi:hypothetical protein